MARAADPRCQAVGVHRGENRNFAQADRIIRRKLRWARSGAQPMETVGAVAEYNPGTGKFTIHANTSMYNYVGWLVAVSLGVPAHRLNIVPTLAGGSFGSKIFTHRVMVIAATAVVSASQPTRSRAADGPRP